MRLIPSPPLRIWVAAVLCGPAAMGASITEGTVATRDGNRHYLLARPEGPARPGRPLVLVLHGHMGSAKNVLGGTRSPLSAWAQLTDREDLVVAALDGAVGPDGQQGWNDGRPGGSGNPSTDDVAFAAAVLARVERECATDPRRVYVMGMSNGGVFTFRLALELDHPLAAVAAAAASMPGSHAPPPARRPLSVLLVAGTADPLMPYDGGQVRFRDKRLGAVLGAGATLRFWREACALAGEPRVEALPHAGPTRAFRETWGPPAGPQVMLLRIQDGGHCEPSLAHRYGPLYTAFCGRQSGDFETVEEVWRFFRDKRAP